MTASGVGDGVDEGGGVGVATTDASGGTDDGEVGLGAGLAAVEHATMSIPATIVAATRASEVDIPQSSGQVCVGRETPGPPDCCARVAKPTRGPYARGVARRLVGA